MLGAALLILRIGVPADGQHTAIRAEHFHVLVGGYMEVYATVADMAAGR